MTITTAYKLPSANSVFLSNSNAWASPTNAYLDNGSGTAGSSSAQTDEHLWSGYGFTSSDIPSASRVVGVEFVTEVLSLPSSTLSVSLYAGAKVGTEKTLAISSTGARGLGGAADDWGASLTGADVLASSFGVVIDTTDNTSFDYFAIRVTWAYALTPNDLESASEVSVPALTTTHILTASDIEAAANIGRPAIKPDKFSPPLTTEASWSDAASDDGAWSDAASDDGTWT